MKQRNVEILEQDGKSYGQVSSPDDLMKGQQYAHDHTTQVTHDFINKTRDAEIAGFDYELSTDNGFDFTVKRPGRIYTKNGLSYELLNDATVTLADPDETYARLDLIVAKLEDEVDAESDQIAFVRLRTTEEYADEVGPYAPVNFEAPREKHWRAVIQVKTGEASANPTLPTYDSNEVPLYVVTVQAGALTIRVDAISDLRDPMPTLRELNDFRGSDRVDLNKALSDILTLKAGAGTPTDPTTAWGQIFAEIRREIAASRDLPEIRYDRPKVSPSDPASAKINASYSSGTPNVIDIEIGARVNFGDAEVSILPQNFADQSLNPRYATVGSPSGHTRHEVALTLGGVTQTSSDGTSSFALKNAVLPVARSYAGMAARDSQHVEIFGGLSSSSGALSDWYTYDIVNDTITARTPSITLPASNAPFMAPYGDGVHVLLIAGQQSASQSPRCFKVNCSTMVVTEILTTKPTGCQFIGDLIATDKIMIVATSRVGTELGSITDFWEFDASDDTFTQVAPTGALPTAVQFSSSACFYAENKLVLVNGRNVDGTGPAKTYIYDSPTEQWIQLSIPPPYSQITTTYGVGNSYSVEAFFRLANVHGRPTLVGDPNALWELVTSASGVEWRSSIKSFGSVYNPGFCSTLGSDSRATGKAAMAGGMLSQGMGQTILSTIYATTQVGLIATTYNGDAGVSVGEGSTVVQFEVPVYAPGFEVAGYRADIVGSNLGSTLVEVSLDNGDHWHTLELGRTLDVTDSDDPAQRRLRVTMYRAGSVAPVLTNLIEILDADGGDLEDRQVVRFDAPTVATNESIYLYIDRNGVVTVEDTATPSTPDKAVIFRARQPDPFVTGLYDLQFTSYVNRRRPVVSHYVPIYGSSDTTLPGGGHFINDLAVPVRYLSVVTVKETTGELVRRVDIPEIDFNEVVFLNDDALSTGTDGYIMELYG